MCTELDSLEQMIGNNRNIHYYACISFEKIEEYQIIALSKSLECMKKTLDELLKQKKKKCN